MLQIIVIISFFLLPFSSFSALVPAATEVLVQTGTHSYEFENKYSSYAQLGAKIQSIFYSTKAKGENPSHLGGEIMGAKLFGPINNSNSYYLEIGPFMQKTLSAHWDFRLHAPMRFEKIRLGPLGKKKYTWWRPRLQVEYIIKPKFSLQLALGVHSQIQFGPKFSLNSEHLGDFHTEILFEQMDLIVKRRSIIIRSGKSF